MVICFNATPEAHTALQRVLATGHYADINAALCAAITNLAVLDTTVAAQGGFVLTTGSAPAPLVRSRPAVAEPASALIPAELKKPTPPFETARFAAPASQPTADEGELGPKGWLWGQFNKVFPVKVTCRGTLNLLLQNPAIKPVEAAAIITKSAAALAVLLRKADESSGRKRDEAFGAAFPSEDRDNEKSLTRFAEQFVYATGSFATSSLPLQMGFVHCAGGELRLTPAGIQFGELENPILDGNLLQSAEKFSIEELDFLRAHILAHVPQERSALRAILRAVDHGATNPDAVDAYLRQLYTAECAELTEPFLGTQRTGAISRAVELKLLRRRRHGIRVTYEVEEAGRSFLGT
jgi:hypothetical protein